MEQLTHQELAILLATRESENALSTEELASIAETTVEKAEITLTGLMQKEILRPFENWDGTVVYMYADSPLSQHIYEEIHYRRI